jgi:hypothetical protein
MKRLIVILLVGVLAAAPAYAVSTTSPTPTEKRLAKQVAVLKKQVATLKGQVTRFKGRVSDLQSRLDGITSERDQARAEVATLTAQVTTLVGERDQARRIAGIVGGPEYGNGTFRVPSEIKPGTFRNSDSSQGCYWERLRDFSGTLDGIIANEMTYGLSVVTIDPSDVGFKSVRCGQWSRLG